MEHLTLRIRVRPRPHRSNSLFTKFERSREPTQSSPAQKAAHCMHHVGRSPRRQWAMTRRHSSCAQLQSFLSLDSRVSSHTRRVRSAEKANFAGTEKTLFTSEGTKTARDASRKVLRTGRQLYEDATAARRGIEKADSPRMAWKEIY